VRAREERLVLGRHPHERGCLGDGGDHGKVRCKRGERRARERRQVEAQHAPARERDAREAAGERVFLLGHPFGRGVQRERRTQRGLVGRRRPAHREVRGELARIERAATQRTEHACSERGLAPLAVEHGEHEGLAPRVRAHPAASAARREEATGDEAGAPTTRVPHAQPCAGRRSGGACPVMRP
jgi:hypothetical protein